MCSLPMSLLYRHTEQEPKLAVVVWLGRLALAHAGCHHHWQQLWAGEGVSACAGSKGCRCVPGWPCWCHVAPEASGPQWLCY
jgi:hypothetical protein